MYPSYEQVLCEKQKCYPEGIIVEEFEEAVPLQNLLDHTAKQRARNCYRDLYEA